jgi:hypothetical protein
MYRIKKIFLLLFFPLIICLFAYTSPLQNATAGQQNQNTYNFVSFYNSKQSLVDRISVPAGFQRTVEKPGSFGDWLRHLPLKPGKPEVHLYNGKLKSNQNVHYAVVDIDVGTTDIQQCADAVMRMRAEYLYSIKDYERLHFNFTSGNTVGFKKWTEGYRTVIQGNKVSWAKKANPSDDYKTFKTYCNTVFNYAGTASLSKELKPVVNIKNIQIGDVFIVGGFPGHAVLVVDMCENKSTGEKLFMIQQSYMPAQEIHILKNYNSTSLSPWYSINFSGDLVTPEWTFKKNQLMRF